jgi:hypothetical protein|nr:MAG TPA: hypothetical protein [Caudoviricetes sp.]
MPPEIIVGLLSLGGTLIGTFGGIMTSAKLTAYRIEQLEKKVNKHNNFAERIPVIENNLKSVWHNIDEIKEDVKEEHNHGNL